MDFSAGNIFVFTYKCTHSASKPRTATQQLKHCNALQSRSECIACVCRAEWYVFLNYPCPLYTFDLTILVCNTQPPLPLPPFSFLHFTYPYFHQTTALLKSAYSTCFYCPIESDCGYADGSGRRWHALECFNASVMHGEFSVVLCLSVWECTGYPVGKKNDKWGLFKISVFLELVRQKENVFYFSRFIS